MTLGYSKTNKDKEDKSSLSYCLRAVWKDHLSSKDHAIFFCKLIVATIDAYFSKQYSSFDAHTTTNCCHGVAVLARHLIHEVSQMDLRTFRKNADEKIRELEDSSKASNFCIDWAPKSLIKLSTLYLLSLTRSVSNGKPKTNNQNLNKIFPINADFRNGISKRLKKNLSNLIAHRYKDYLNEICHLTDINGAPIGLWGNYIQNDHIRIDKKNTHYAPCVFSTQVSLAYLIKSKAKIAIVNDIVRSNGELHERYVRVFQGDGKDRFHVLPEIIEFESIDPSEPVVVFGGYVYSDSITLEELSKQIEPWLNEFPKLMLACDVFYPHFPGINDDPHFDSSPIQPEEPILQEIFATYSRISGVSSCDPSLYCSSHTYLSSFDQVLKVMHKMDRLALPYYCLARCFHGLDSASPSKRAN